jgi:hypothetical protein
MMRRSLQESEWKEIAEFLGRNLAALHSLPMQTRETFWQEMDDAIARSCCYQADSGGSEASGATERREALLCSWTAWKPFCTFFNKRREVTGKKPCVLPLCFVLLSSSIRYSC